MVSLADDIMCVWVTTESINNVPYEVQAINFHGMDFKPHR